MTTHELKELIIQTNVEIFDIETDMAVRTEHIEGLKQCQKDRLDELKNRKGYLNELITELKRNEKEEGRVEV